MIILQKISVDNRYYQTLLREALIRKKQKKFALYQIQERGGGGGGGGVEQTISGFHPSWKLYLKNEEQCIITTLSIENNWNKF